MTIELTRGMLIASALFALLTAVLVPDTPYRFVAAAFYLPLAWNAWIDARTQLLVKTWTHLAGLVALAWATTGWLIEQLVTVHLVHAFVSAVFVGGILWVAASRKLIGRGDARLVAVLALWHGLVGPSAVLAFLTIAVLAHGAYALVRIAVRRSSWDTTHAFGPWLIGASWLVTVSPVVNF